MRNAAATISRTGSSTRSTDVLQLIEANEHVPWFGTVRRTEHAGRVELIDDARRAPIPDLQPTLKQRCRALLMLDHDFGSVAEQLVAVCGLPILPGGSARLQCFAFADDFENVRLDLSRLLDGNPLRRVRRALGISPRLIP